MMATYCLQDNKLRLYPIEKLDDDTRNRAKELGFKWARTQKLYVAPMWTPARHDFLLDLCDMIEDEQSTLQERSNDRARRFKELAGKRASEANNHRDNADMIAERYAYNQPILVGHHSESKHRNDFKRLDNHMRKSIKLAETAEYWERKASGAVRSANYKDSPDVRARRIKKLQADKRRCDRDLGTHKLKIKFWTSPKLTDDLAIRCATSELKHQYYAGSITMDKLKNAMIYQDKRDVEHYRRWSEHYKIRIQYEENILKNQLEGHKND